MARQDYVQITREDLEEWLDTLTGQRGNWRRKQGSEGVYLLPQSDAVAIYLSSSITSRMGEGAMARGRASAQFKLVSLITGRTLNKKAQGQKGFHRTKNWRTNWKKGFETFRQTYIKSTDFYERIARDDERGRGQGSPTAPAQTAPSAPDPNRIPPGEIEGYLERLRHLWLAARQAGDNWTMDFVKSVSARVKKGWRPSDKQRNILEDKSDRYWRALEQIEQQRGGRRATSTSRLAHRYFRQRAQTVL